MTRLVLVRHGEAQAYLEQVVAGEKGCTGLSDEGRRQAQALAERLARTDELAPVDALYASVLPRAVETAAIIAPAVGAGGALEIEQDCDLCELHPGECDGMTWDEFRSRYGVEDGQWDPERVMSPGGESWLGFIERVRGGLGRLVEKHPDDTVVVACHGGVIIASMVIGLGVAPVGGNFREGPANTSLTEWLIEDGTWKIVRYNDHAHLL